MIPLDSAKYTLKAHASYAFPHKFVGKWITSVVNKIRNLSFREGC